MFQVLKHSDPRFRNLKQTLLLTCPIYNIKISHLTLNWRHYVTISSSRSLREISCVAVICIASSTMFFSAVQAEAIINPDSSKALIFCKHTPTTSLAWAASFSFQVPSSTVVQTSLDNKAYSTQGIRKTEANSDTAVQIVGANKTLSPHLSKSVFDMNNHILQD